MDQLDFVSPPLKKSSPARMAVLGSTLFVALLAMLGAVVLPGMRTTDDRSKATMAGTCAGTVSVSAATCNEKCIVSDDCGGGLVCSAGFCRSSQNPSSTTCGATATATPITTQPVPATSSSITFNELTGVDASLNGIYPTGVVNWGSNVWNLSGPWGSLNTNSISYASNVKTANFTFVSAKKLVSLVAYNGGTVSSTITIACGGNTTKSQTLAVGAQATIQTGFTTACTSVTIGSSNGWDTNFDTIVYQSSSVPAPTAVPASTGEVSRTVKFVFRSTATGQDMALDYIKDGTTIIDDNSSLLTYSGAWSKGSDSSPYGGSYVATSQAGSAVSYSTTSPSVIIRPYRYPTRGRLAVYVDGVLKRTITNLATGSGWSDIVVSIQ